MVVIDKYLKYLYHSIIGTTTKKESNFLHWWKPVLPDNYIKTLYKYLSINMTVTKMEYAIHIFWCMFCFDISDVLSGIMLIIIIT